VPDQLRFAPPVPTPKRGWQRQAPSAHESQPSRRLGELLRTRPVHAFERGTLIHKWFEQIEWIDDGQPSKEQLLAAARTLPPTMLDPAKVLPEFFAMLDQPTIKAALSRNQSPHHPLTPQVLREHPFACRFEQTLVSGIIDRLILWQEAGQVVAAELLDFKTGAVSGTGSPLETRIAEYRPQLQSYRRAVAQLFGLDLSHVTARLVFVQPGVVVSVS
jgi:ATP-dependent exoDNAse (exonuclease V) beta subunit